MWQMRISFSFCHTAECMNRQLFDKKQKHWNLHSDSLCYTGVSLFFVCLCDAQQWACWIKLNKKNQNDMREINVRNKCVCVTTCEDYTEAPYPNSACNSVRLQRVCSGLISYPGYVLFYRHVRNLRKKTAISFIMSVRPHETTCLPPDGFS